jgi:MFS family permease
MALFTLGSSVGALFTGPLGDRIGHRRMLVVGTAGFAICLALHGTFTTRWGFYLLAIPHGVIWSAVLTGTMATLGSVLPEDRRADGLALYGLASPAGVVVGPIAGLWAFEHLGFPGMVWSLALMFLALAWLAAGLPAPSRTSKSGTTFRWPEAAVILPCVVLFAVALGYGAVSSYSAQEGKALGFRFPGAFLSTMAAGMVAMRLAMARTGFGNRPMGLYPWMLGLATGSYALMALLPGGLPRHLLAAAGYGAGYSVVFTLSSSYLLEVVPPERRGGAFGSLLFAFDAGIGLGSFALGWVIGRHSYRAGWALGALAMLLVLPLGVRLGRPTKK